MKFILLFIIANYFISNPLSCPVNVPDRQAFDLMKLTSIGQFGALRKARNGIPAHLHSGIDVKRPHPNYFDEPIFPVAEGKVISIRRDSTYAQIIIEHKFDGETFWTLYEHIAGILVSLNQKVEPSYPIARFMNKDELNRYGWQFDHFHFEVLKVEPLRMQPTQLLPERRFNAYTLACFTEKDLIKYYHNPLFFFKTKK